MRKAYTHSTRSGGNPTHLPWEHEETFAEYRKAKQPVIEILSPAHTKKLQEAIAQFEKNPKPAKNKARDFESR